MAVFVDNRKLTRNLAKAVRYEADKEKACKYLTSQEGWTNKEFDEVDWDRLYIALGKQPEGYKTWLAK